MNCKDDEDAYELLLKTLLFFPESVVSVFSCEKTKRNAFIGCEASPIDNTVEPLKDTIEAVFKEA